MTKPRKTPDSLAAAITEVVAEVVTESDMDDVQRVVLAKAKDGNMHAAAIAERAWRRRPARPVKIDLPPVDDAGGLAAAQVALIAKAANGEITAQQALAFAQLIEHRRRALDLVEYETRLVAIEAENAERTRRKSGDLP
jgi:hypothetical protein